jgi:hypothetical protein
MNRKTATVFGIIAAAALPLLSAYSQETPAPAPPAAPSPEAVPANFSPAVGEAVKLAQSGVGEDVVAAYVKNTQAPYNLSANDIIALRNAGISEPIVTAMLNHDKALQTQAPPPSYQQRPYIPANPPSTIPNAPTAPAAPMAPPAPSVAPPPSIDNQVPLVTPPLTPSPTIPTMVEQAPPPPRGEVVPVAPGPDYNWVPGYWTWNGTWIWLGGRWGIRPWHGAAWSSGHWARHGRGYIWIGGRWR